MPALLPFPQSTTDAWTSLREKIFGPPKEETPDWKSWFEEGFKEAVYPRNPLDAIASGMMGLGPAAIGRDQTMRWKKYFNPSTTDLPMYDEMINNALYHIRKNRLTSMQMMAPSEYLDALTQLKGRGTTIADELRATSPMTVTRYANEMRKGEKFPIPILDKLYGEQEGRHRMLAAQELGLTDVPVLTIDDFKKVFGE